MTSKITTRFVLLVATAAVAPLVVYGVVSISSLWTGTRQSVIAGNLNVAARAAEEIRLYIDNNIKVLQALGTTLRNTRLQLWQQDRLVKDWVLDFPEFREITLFDQSTDSIVSSRLGAPRLTVPSADILTDQAVYLAPITVDDDLLPTTTVAIRLTEFEQTAGWLVGELSLEELWRMVDSIRVGEEGFALVLAQDGLLIAHGDPDEKVRVARGENLRDHPLLVSRVTGQVPASTEYADSRGRTILAVAASIESRGWTVVVEQPTSEAYRLATALQIQLISVIAVALLVTIALGYLWGRSFIRPIFALMRGTQAIAEGRLDERVRIGGKDEFHELGDAFNGMADRLVELQANVRRQERQAMFGRIAAGLVHDISHPIQNIGNGCKLIVKLFDDYEYRGTFKRMVQREFATIKRVLEDLRHLASPMPLERFPIDVNRSVADVLESMRSLVDTAGLSLEARLTPEPLYIEGDLFALGRVYRNLILNAIEATSPGGTLTVTSEEHGERVRISVSDTGPGIPADRQEAIFEDCKTTKRRGLGLGLAISSKIVEQLSGTISVTSQVGAGTTFTLEFPKTAARPVVVVAAAS